MAVRPAMNTTYSDRLIQLMLPLRAGSPCTTGFHLSHTRDNASWKNRPSSRRHPKPSTDLYVLREGFLQCKIEFQNVDARFAEDPKAARFRCMRLTQLTETEATRMFSKLV